MDPNNRSLLAARNKKKNIHILKVSLTIVPDQVPKKWVSEVSWGKGLRKVDQGISSFLAKFLA